MLLRKIFLYSLLIITLSFSGCGITKNGASLNLFTADQDLELGKEVEQQIKDDPKQFPILKESQNKEVYQYIRRITQKILNSGQVKHKNKFVWKISIIDDDKTLNAFCTPGGYIYVYTGLIKYLDSEDQLAGVMAHEIAHADLRHSTRQMTKIYGVSALISIVTKQAEPGLLSKIATSLISLKFSRSHETESDMNSVKYLCNTDYNAAGAAGFFKKIQSDKSPPEFLSTHPSPANRVQNIEKRARETNCRGRKTYKSAYDKIKKKL